MKFQIIEYWNGEDSTGLCNITPDCEEKLRKNGIVYHQEYSGSKNPETGKKHMYTYVDVKSLEEMTDLLKKLGASLEDRMEIYVPTHLTNWNIYNNWIEELSDEEIENDYDNILQELMNDKAIYTVDDNRHPYYTKNKNDNEHKVIWDGLNVINNVENWEDDISSLYCYLRNGEAINLQDFYDDSEDFLCDSTRTKKEFLNFIEKAIADIEEED